jgi:glutathione-regulated potassium-efflux system protein KefB
MDPHSFIYSAVLLLVVASIAVALFRHLGLGTILGLLVTGIIVGPHTPGPFVTKEVDSVRQFTEIGVVMLLFLIGLEMKPSRLWGLRRMLFGLGSLQIILSTLGIAVYFRLFHESWTTALLLGASFALSSTAIVIQMLRDRGEVASAHGQTAFAVLLMQDLAVVPLLAAIPVVADTGPLPLGLPLWERAGVAVAMVSMVVVIGRYAVPWALDYLARRNHREAFFLTALAAMFMAALAMDRAGMSMALGAFLMGMMLSTSRYSLQIEAAMEPHKGLLMSLFFVAVGMSVDVQALARNPLEFSAHVLAIVTIKVAILFGLCLAFGTGRRTALRVAFLLSQGGEFGFVVFGSCKALGLIDDQTFVTAIAVISFSMLLTPILIKLGGWLTQRYAPDATGMAPAYGHHDQSGSDAIRAVIAGYGRVGHTVGTILGTRPASRPTAAKSSFTISSTKTASRGFRSTARRTFGFKATRSTRLWAMGCVFPAVRAMSIFGATSSGRRAAMASMSITTARPGISATTTICMPAGPVGSFIGPRISRTSSTSRPMSLPSATRCAPRARPIRRSRCRSPAIPNAASPPRA